MISIIDYGVGNLFSLSSSLKYLGIDALVTKNEADIMSSSHIILPGVGAFGDAMAKLRESGLIPTLRREVEKGKPFLGICVGMQMLFEKSYEYGEHEGLGFLRGEIRPLDEDLRALGLDLKVPQMGWNSLRITGSCPILKYTHEGEHVYYVHSFYAKNCEKAIMAGSDYGVFVPAVVQSGKVYGTQFHPEKSGGVGLNILRAFFEMGCGV